MTKEYDWKTDYDWTDLEDHPVITQEVQPKEDDNNIIPLFKEAN